MNAMQEQSSLLLHPFQYAVNTKPVQAIDSLYSALVPYGKKIHLKRGAVYNFTDDNAGVILLDEGVVTACNTETNLFIHSVFSTTILGFSDLYSMCSGATGYPKHSFYCETNVVIYFVPLNMFIFAMNEEKLWRPLAQILAHRLAVMSSRGQTLIGVASYQAIRTLLIEVWSYPEKYRSQINIASFIQKRTRLSRSRVMKVLAELKLGGYIDIKSGKLVALNILPEDF